MSTLEEAMRESIIASRNAQQNTETSGAKCNRCAFDITWNDKAAIEKFGKNRPFEKGFEVGHDCPKDENGKEIMRQGYAITQTPEGKNKVVCLVPKSNQTTLQTSAPSQAPSRPRAGDASLSSVNELRNEIVQLSNNIGTLTMELSKMNTKHNQDIAELRAIVQNYTQYNPFAAMFKDLTDKMLQYLPEPELGPKRADELI